MCIGIKTLIYFHNYFIFLLPLDPDIALPMEHEDHGVLLGSISGQFIGGASLSTGKVGKALYVDGIGQYVDLGKHETQCFYNPDVCDEGSAFSVWIKPQQLDVSSTIFDTGASDSSSSGYYFGTLGQTDLKVAVKISDIFYYYIFTAGESWRLNHWIHITFTWDIHDGIRFYINGCNTDPDESRGYAYTIPRSTAWTGYKRFLIGVGFGYIRMYMDEFYIWHTALTSNAVWQFYSQGGTPWLAQLPCHYDIRKWETLS